MRHKSGNPVTRREALCRMGNGFGMMAFASLLGDSLYAAGARDTSDGLQVSKLGRASCRERV